jgi:hypothetical protein
MKVTLQYRVFTHEAPARECGYNLEVESPFLPLVGDDIDIGKDAYEVAAIWWSVKGNQMAVTIYLGVSEFESRKELNLIEEELKGEGWTLADEYNSKK